MSTPKCYYAIIAPDLEVLSSTSAAGLVSQLRMRREEERNSPANNKVVLVMGERFYMTKGEFKHLVLPNNTRLPLFEVDEESLDTEEGYLIDRPRVEVSEKEETDEGQLLDEPYYEDD